MELKEVGEGKSNIPNMQGKVIENSNVQTSSVPIQEMKKGKLKMLDTQELQVVAQLVDNMEIIIGNLEEAYSEKNAEKFKKSKDEILNSQKKIDEMLR